MKILLSFAVPVVALFLAQPGEMATVSPTVSCPVNFTTLEGRCIFIATDVYFDPRIENAKNWTRARDVCTSMFGEGDLWKTDLAIVDVTFIETLYSYIAENLPGIQGFTYWIGSQKVEGQWKWIDGSPISNMSYVWHPLTHHPRYLMGSLACSCPLGHLNACTCLNRNRPGRNRRTSARPSGGKQGGLSVPLHLIVGLRNKLGCGF
ncbi:uncharacterized protein [Macrobrachium rosenbergii]|uniref:uncharacterized protein n=1 Tax=Macrobrachium rosenbergii TaxID=79674 RepID=UPI0034D63F88